ncbi:MAG: nitroreductase family protein, partial [Chloroflexota bacterium]
GPGGEGTPVRGRVPPLHHVRLGMVTQTPISSRVAALEELIRDRRSIREFRAEPPSRGLIEEMLQHVLWSPSPHNVQPWRFTVLFQRSDRERLATAMGRELDSELRAGGLDAEAIEKQVTRSQHRISTAPVAILCSVVGDGLVSYGEARRDGLEWQMAVQSVGAVLQTLFLIAASHGIGTCWMAAPMYCPRVVRGTLSLPDGFSPQALVLLGYPAAGGRMRARLPFDEVVDIR